MAVCRTVLFALAATCFALPAAAQSPYAQGVERGPNQPVEFIGYPEFLPVKAHILQQIDEAGREERITPGQAEDFLDVFAEIGDDEARDYRFYGWNPPVDVRDDIRYALNRLSQDIDGEAGY
jgi:hypothetical protein